MRFPGAALVVAAVFAIGLSACSSAPPRAHARTRTHKSTTTTRATSTSTTSGTTSTSTTTTAPPTSAATCQASGLRIFVSGQGGAAGTQELTFSMANTSSSPCTTYGYPGMLLLATTGKALPTRVVRGGRLNFENVAPSRVTLAPAAVAYFNVGFTDVQTDTTTCSSAHRVEVTPPTNTAHAGVDDGLGIYACDDGTLHVSAVFPSSSPATQTTAPPAE